MLDERQLPAPFFETVVHDLTGAPALLGVCASYESGAWRCEQLSKYLMNWLPEFCLSFSERQKINDETAVAAIRQAAKVVYDSDKYDRRGEFGELLLHAILREKYKTIPAVSKIYFKDSVNDTVKGFDAVHVVSIGNALELWLGEVKFYKDISQAIAAVVDELQAHFEDDYLKKEFILIGNKVDSNWPHADKLKLLLDPNTSLDKVFTQVCVPVLLTYDSTITAAHKAYDAAYRAAIETELRHHHAEFASKNDLTKVTVHLLLLPLATKAALLTALHKTLQAWQQI